LPPWLGLLPGRAAVDSRNSDVGEPPPHPSTRPGVWAPGAGQHALHAPSTRKRKAEFTRPPCQACLSSWWSLWRVDRLSIVRIKGRRSEKEPLGGRRLRASHLHLFRTSTPPPQPPPQTHRERRRMLGGWLHDAGGNDSIQLPFARGSKAQHTPPPQEQQEQAVTRRAHSEGPAFDLDPSSVVEVGSCIWRVWVPVPHTTHKHTSGVDGPGLIRTHIHTCTHTHARHTATPPRRRRPGGRGGSRRRCRSIWRRPAASSRPPSGCRTPMAWYVRERGAVGHVNYSPGAYH
jgi:hypothetical protein